MVHDTVAPHGGDDLETVGDRLGGEGAWRDRSTAARRSRLRIGVAGFGLPNDALLR